MANNEMKLKGADFSISPKQSLIGEDDFSMLLNLDGRSLPELFSDEAGSEGVPEIPLIDEDEDAGNNGSTESLKQNKPEPMEKKTPAQTKVDVDQCSSPVPLTVNQKTPHSSKRTTIHRRSKKRPNGVEVTPPKVRQTPLPLLSWADSKEIWQNMVYKEEVSMVYRNAKLFERKYSFLPRMRAILLDWIMEVCEVYRLRRVTYYLAVDYVDRYLTIRPDVPKTQLQLVGVSCLFMASKLEEVYPPKLSEFSYVCDGACTNSEILACELLILNTLGWDVNPMTPSGWLNLYMQIHFDGKNVGSQHLHREINHNFHYPQYSGFQFVRASQIMDLFSLDPGFLRYSYSTIAAAAMYFIFGKQVALDVSGLAWDHLKECVEYMAVFYKVIRDTSDPRLHSVPSCENEHQNNSATASLRHSVPNVVVNENHSMQTHCVDLDYFERATLLRLEQMGLKVEKTYMKKIKKKTKPKEGNGESAASTTEQEETTVVMFDVEKITMEKSIAPEAPTDGDDEPEELVPSVNVNIFCIEKKTRVTFDDILASINETANNTKQIQESSSSEDELDSM